MALSIEDFIRKWGIVLLTDGEDKEFRADLELIILNARTEGIWEANAAFDKGQRLVSLKRRK